VVSTCFAWDDVINVHLTLICATQLTSSAIAHEHALSLFAITPAV
jgi:predicted transcriptional regulator of viral defense system